LAIRSTVLILPASNASTDDFVERFLSATAWIPVDQGPTVPRSQTQYESRELMALLADLDRKDREWKPSYPFVVLLLMEDRGRAVSRPALATLRPFNLAVEEIFGSIK
jgi:hypothetical protein